MERSAEISVCGQYRYALRRIWDSNEPSVLFIALNPSTADAHLDDSTLRRCIKFAATWGYGGVTMANLFAFRATSPKVLRRVADPVGPENDMWLDELTTAAKAVVAAWGNLGRLHDRAAIVSRRLGKLYCLERTVSGAPKHPLYVRGTANLTAWDSLTR